MRLVVLGAGMMGRAVAYDLARSDCEPEVMLVDIDSSRLREAARLVGDGRLTTRRVDVTDNAAAVDLMRGAAGVVSAVTYQHNYGLARAAVEAGANFCDLGGNDRVVERELGLDGAAKAAGVTIIPDCGLAPGMASVLTADALGRFDSVDGLHIRVGGLPQHPKPPLNYKIVFSPTGLINEYVEPVRVIRDGEMRTVEPLGELEEIEFPEPFGVLEAFSTSGGISTLPRTFKGRVRELDYKTIRYPGHCAAFKTLLGLGLASGEPVRVGDAEVVPRALFERLLLEKLSDDDRDVILFRLWAEGSAGGVRRRLTYEIIDYHDEPSGLGAMMRTTAFPAAIVALMAATGEITEKGACPQEMCVPSGRFIEEIRRRGIDLRIEWD